MPELFNQPDLWKYLSIPLLAAVVGWFTNWVAIKMSFWPLDFIGIPPLLGWQGIVPRKRMKMAKISVASVLSRLSSINDVFERLDPDQLAGHIVRSIDPQLDYLIDERMEQQYPTAWMALPEGGKARMRERVRDQLPDFVDDLMHELSENADRLIDMEALVLDKVAAEKDLLNRFFNTAGERELRFIVNSGLYFGFPLGIVQMFIWFYYPAWWILPFFGFLVGYLTNWLAINLIFRPLKPIKVGPWEIQGLFLKRQDAASKILAELITRDVITLPILMNAMMQGPNKELARRIVRRHVMKAIDTVAGPLALPMKLAMGAAAHDRMREQLADEVVAMSTEQMQDDEFQVERAQKVADMMAERMAAMPPEEYQALLRPAFQEDEIILILVGAVLGASAGIAQLVFVFGGSIL